MTSTPRPIANHLPILLLLLALLLFGLCTFRDYGLSWDEPLFYDYGEALGYAYTPANWFRPDFDLNNSYGSSGDDHKTRGPAYLLLARTPAHLIQSLSVDQASAWHLVNFLTFLPGIYFVYRLSRRWMGEWAAFGAAALFSTQPLLLGHAFINPKDMPFLVFFSGALVFGFEMVDGLNSKTKPIKQKIIGVIAAAFFLGSATSIRVLAPLAGILVVVFFFAGALRVGNAPYSSEQNIRSYSESIPLHKKALWVLLYAAISMLFMLASWPYLWEAPLKNFFQVFLFMSENPTGLHVLFNGEIYRAYDLPRRILPTLLAITLTEPVWPLFITGIVFAFWKAVVAVRPRGSPAYSTTAMLNGPPKDNRQKPIAADYWLTLSAFLIPFLYVLLLRPPMYDGFRHFLFILPPIFVTAGLGLQAILNWFERIKIKPQGISWLYALLVFIMLAVNLLPAARLHPYEYAYYNSFAGGTGGAFRTYETDYWLTCYKEAVEQVNALGASNLYVHREAYIAATYAASGINVFEERGNLKNILPGDYILVNSRTNEDRKTFRDAPVMIEIGRDGAIFCVVKQAP